MENFSSDEDSSPVSAREERKKTGRYIAVCMAISITLLGLYQGMVQHTPLVTGLFAPAVIMFLYVFWVLWTASNTKKKLREQELEDMEEEKALSEVISESPPVVKDVNIQNENLDNKTERKLTRSYSIA